MTWKKLGVIFCPDNIHPMLVSHAANPLPVHLKGDIYRVFYGGRDKNNRTSVGAVDIDIIRQVVINKHHEPVFTYGPPGSFYADGVSIGNCYRAGGMRYMLFMGWQNPPDGHWRGDIGRLIVHDDLSLSLESEQPFISTDETDPTSLSYPWVMPDDSGGFHMWYGSTLEWDAGNGEMTHVINYAHSTDGHHWQRHGLCVPYKKGVAQAFSRPCVIRDDTGHYHMWFSYRSGTGQTYRIGYASSDQPDRDWQLDPEQAGIDVSDQGWDSQMIEYPYVLEHKGKLYMFYNGNSYGLSGFGLAVRE